jgi:predicted DCC family thiol-disulfide oxidoreductase YuxK
MTRPLVVFDGACGFCRLWIERWREMTGDSVDYRPSSEVAADFPEIPQEEFDRAVQLIRPDRTRASGAAAVLEFTAPHSAAAQAGLFLNNRLPVFAGIIESAYGFVAANRVVFSWLTKLLWGSSARRPTFAAANTVFLRALALIFLIALVSYWQQAAGLNAILPVAPFFEAARNQLGAEAYWALPSLVWLSPELETLNTLVGIGVAASALALLGILQPLCFLTLWAVMLSLCVVGRDFYSFQWDALLIEVGFLAVFISPWRLRPNFSPCEPPRLARFLVVALLFRLMFSSGVVKLTSGDLAWRSLTAFEFHFFTQPLPNPMAWFAHQLPAEFLVAICALMFFIELVLPFAFFLPRNLRLLSAWSTIALQVGIALTGNFAFFNILSTALALFLLDDRCWPGFLQNKTTPVIFITRWIRTPFLVSILLLSLIPLASAFRTIPAFLSPLAHAHSVIAPLRTINAYGLFAMMTTSRHEILVQGSNDGHDWKTYGFRYKPGPPNRTLPVVAPYQPRLDWQMWFAALGRVEKTPWFRSFLTRLLDGSPEVLALLEKNPFPNQPPKFIRAVLDNYTFTTPDERTQSGAIWKGEPLSIYCHELRKSDSAVSDLLGPPQDSFDLAQ